MPRSWRAAQAATALLEALRAMNPDALTDVDAQLLKLLAQRSELPVPAKQDAVSASVDSRGEARPVAPPVRGGAANPRRRNSLEEELDELLGEDEFNLTQLDSLFEDAPRPSPAPKPAPKPVATPSPPARRPRERPTEDDDDDAELDALLSDEPPGTPSRSSSKRGAPRETTQAIPSSARAATSTAQPPKRAAAAPRAEKTPSTRQTPPPPPPPPPPPSRRVAARPWRRSSTSCWGRSFRRTRRRILTRSCAVRPAISSPTRRRSPHCHRGRPSRQRKRRRSQARASRNRAAVRGALHERRRHPRMTMTTRMTGMSSLGIDKARGLELYTRTAGHPGEGSTRHHR